MTLSTNHAGRARTALNEPLEAISEALGHMRFGVIQLTVHEGRVVQLDVTERRRFAQ